MIYRVRGWNEHFENNKSRERDECSFICVPNAQGGIGFNRIMREPDGAAIYGIWCLLIGKLSRQKRHVTGDTKGDGSPILSRQGYLTEDGRPDGSPLTADDLSICWHRPVAEIQHALDFLSDPAHKVCWIEAVSPSVPTECPPSARLVPAECPSGALEGKGREGKGKEGNPTGGAAITPPDATDRHPDLCDDSLSHATGEAQSAGTDKPTTRTSSLPAGTVISAPQGEGNPARIGNHHAPSPHGDTHNPPVRGATETRPTAKPRARTPDKLATDPNHRPAVKYFCDQWAAKYGVKCAFDGGKDAKIIAMILGHVDRDLARFRATVDAYLADENEFVVRDRHGLGLLKSLLRRYLAADASRGQVILGTLCRNVSEQEAVAAMREGA